MIGIIKKIENWIRTDKAFVERILKHIERNEIESAKSLLIDWKEEIDKAYKEIKN